MQVSLGARISDLGKAWRVLGSEQRVAAVGSILLIVSTVSSNFTWVEVAEIVTALAVLLLLKRRADGYEFHLPFGDGTAIAAAGVWCTLLILVRLFDRPLGQSALALAGALLILGAGISERAKRPMDDLPDETLKIPRNVMARDDDEEVTQRLPGQGSAPAAPPPRRPPR